MVNSYLNKPVLSIVATKSGTGKTTLIEKLIPILKNRGYKIGILKHDAHKFDIDKKGKDTYRFSEAGADNVIIASKDKLAMVKNLEEEKSIEDILKLFSEEDLIIVEGFKNNKYPKIEVHRAGVDTNLLCNNENFLIESFMAVASDEKLDVNIPVININDAEQIADFIEKNLRLNSNFKE